jgi:hypothetical protein
MKKMKCITSFIDIGRGDWQTNYKRSNDKYIDNFIKFYSNINLDVIVFCNNIIKLEIENKISLCDDFKSTVSFENITIDEIDIFNKLDTIKNIMDNSVEMSNYKKRDNSNPPEYSNPKYVAMMFAKIELLKLANERGLINEDIIAWIDFGIGHGNQDYINRISNKILIEPEDKNKIIFFNRQPSLRLSQDPNFYSNLSDNVLIIGGFYIIPKKLINYYYNNINDIIENDFLNKYIIDDDQTIMSIFAAKNKEICKIIDSSKYKANPNGGDFFPVFDFLK